MSIGMWLCSSIIPASTMSRKEGQKSKVGGPKAAVDKWCTRGSGKSLSSWTSKIYVLLSTKRKGGISPNP